MNRLITSHFQRRTLTSARHSLSPKSRPTTTTTTTTTTQDEENEDRLLSSLPPSISVFTDSDLSPSSESEVSDSNEPNHADGGRSGGRGKTAGLDALRNMVDAYSTRSRPNSGAGVGAEAGETTARALLRMGGTQSSNSSLPSSVLYRKSVDIYGTPVDSFVNAAHLSPHALLRTPPRTYYQRMNPFSLLGSNFDLGVGSNAAKRTDMYVDYAKDMVPDLRKEWMNPGGVTKNYVSELGRIMSRRDTKLSRRNQRRLTKLVKRARAAGSISIFTKTVPKDKPRDPTRGWGVDRDRRDAGRTSAF